MQAGRLGKASDRNTGTAAAAEQRPPRATTAARLLGCLAGTAIGLCTPLAAAQPDDGDTRTQAVWAEKGMIKNPVGIGTDPHGNIYVAESDRAGNAVTDTRFIGHLDPIMSDLRLQSVEDRRALIQSWIDDGHFEPDFFTRTEDRVRVVRDTDGDGVADTAEVFAPGFNDTVDGIGASVLWHDGSVYFTCIPHVWKLTDTDGDFIADEREPISSGYGVRWCFYGHDLHGLVTGPDGRLYFTMGDRGFNVVTQEGERYEGQQIGAVFRCWPDGSGLEIVHSGLRNPQDLAFDDFGYMFTGDNNCDAGDRARMVAVVEGADSGWRQDVQSLSHRGPWLREKIWETRPSLTDPIYTAWTLPPLAYLGAGPSGMLYYPGTGENDAFAGTMMMVDFYGSGAIVHSFKPRLSGATFELTEVGQYYKGVTVTDIVWGPDGRLYLSDWGGGWEPNPNGNIFTITNETAHADADHATLIDEVQTLLAEGFDDRGEGELAALLGHTDQRVRLGAQFALAKQSADQTLAGVLNDSAAPLLARVHAVWGLGQIARADAAAAERIRPALRASNERLVAQAVLTLGDLRVDITGELADLLIDGNPEVRMHSAIAAGKVAQAHGTEASLRPLLIDLLLDNADQDPTLRHAASYGLSLMGEAEALASLTERLEKPARLGAVLALRHMQSPAVARFLTDEDPQVATEAARAVYDLSLQEVMPELAAAIDGGELREDLAIEPFARRAIEANAMLGGEQAAQRLAALASNPAVPAEWRQLALERLDTWAEPIVREGVWGHLVEREAKDAAVRRLALVSALPDIAGAAQADTGEPADKARERLTRLRGELTDVSAEEMLAEALNADRAPAARATALRAAVASTPKAGDKAAMLARVLEADSAPPALRIETLTLLADAEPAAAVSFADRLLASGTAAEKQQAVSLAFALAAQAEPAAQDIVQRLRRGATFGRVDPEIALELDGLLRGESEPSYELDLLVAGGDSRRGRDLFFNDVDAQCLRCHIAEGQGNGIAGPNLDGVAIRRSMEFLARSIVHPNAEQTEGYNTVTLGLQGGQSVTGIEGKSAPPGSTQIIVGTEPRLISNSQIVSRTAAPSAMPEMTAKLTPGEIRDIVAYLGTLTEAPAAVAHGGQAGIAGAEAEQDTGADAAIASADTGETEPVSQEQSAMNEAFEFAQSLTARQWLGGIIALVIFFGSAAFTGVLAWLSTRGEYERAEEASHHGH